MSDPVTVRQSLMPVLSSRTSTAHRMGNLSPACRSRAWRASPNGLRNLGVPAPRWPISARDNDSE